MSKMKNQQVKEILSEKTESQLLEEIAERVFVQEIDNFTIESGIPIPDYFTKRGRFDAVVDALKVGESFLIEDKNPEGTRKNFYIISKKKGIKLVSRTIDKNHLRVWRKE